MSWFGIWFGNPAGFVADITSDAIVQSLSIRQLTPATSTVASGVVQSLSLGQRARGRVRIVSAALVHSLSIGQTASGGPGKTPTP